MIEDKEPVANEKQTTPMIMIMIPMALSGKLLALKSPKPTVVIVAIVK